MNKRVKDIDEYTKEEIFAELQKSQVICDCLRQEIKDIKEIVHALNSYRGTNTNNINIVK